MIKNENLVKGWTSGSWETTGCPINYRTLTVFVVVLLRPLPLTVVLMRTFFPLVVAVDLMVMRRVAILSPPIYSILGRFIPTTYSIIKATKKQPYVRENVNEIVIKLTKR